MNIKSLLIGSAAALVATTGARAADAIVIAEPEPVEYVRVCDAYGAGFFYIPGTETCLQISGYVWYQMGAAGVNDPFQSAAFATAVAGFVPPATRGDLRAAVAFARAAGIGLGDIGFGTDTPGYAANADGWSKSTRARLNIDARSETEWGTLRSYIRFQASWGTPVDGPVAADQAYIQLGGLMMGYSESFFVDSKNGGPSNYGSHSWGGMYYGYQQRHLLGYRWTGSNGLFAAFALEDDTLTGEGYMPDVVAKVGVSQGWGAAWATVGIDETYGLFNDTGYAVTLGLVVNVPNAPGSSLRVLGYYNDSDNAYGPNSPIGVDPEWSLLASYQHRFTPTFAASVAGQYFSDLYLPGTDVSTGVDAWGAELQLLWTPIENFEIRSELHYDEVDDLDGTVSGYLRFTRYF